jgi:outer membrane protein TolC
MNEFVKIFYRTALMLLVPAWTAADTPKGDYFARITYADAVQLALQKNFAIEGASFDPLISRAQLRSAEGKFDPAITLAYTYNENEQDLTGLNVTTGPTPADGLIQPGLITRNTRNFAEANLGGLTPWGMDYELGVTLENQQTSQNNYTNRFATFAGFSITQPVLQGFGTDVNLASVRIASANVAISHLAYRRQIIETVTRVAEVYNELWFSSGNAEVERRSRNLAAQLAADNQRRAEIGVMSPLDVLQADTDVAAREERVLVAEREQADDENFLKQLVTNRVEDVLKIRLEIEPPPRAPGISAERQSDLAAAIENRPDYQAALLELQKKKINVVFTRNSTLPQLDLVASLGSNGLDRDLSDSINRTVENGALAMSVGGVFSIPIPNNTAIGNLEAAKLEVARQLVELKRLEQSIFVEADNTAGQVETAAKRISATRKARELAARTLEAGETRLRAGTATTFEVLQFQRDLASAAISEIRAMADYNIAVARYQQATGTTLVRQRISLAD